MAGLAQAQYAMQALNGVVIFEGGRPLQVSIAFPGSGGGSHSGSLSLSPSGSSEYTPIRGGRR